MKRKRRRNGPTSVVSIEEATAALSATTREDWRDIANGREAPGVVPDPRDEEIRQLREALAWYADPATWRRKDHYSSPSQDFPSWTGDSPATVDGGQRARTALAKANR